MSRQQKHRRLGCPGRAQRADRIGMPGAAGDQRNAYLAGRARPGVSHVHGSRLMADMNEIHAAPERRIEHRHHVIARQGEDFADPGARERFDYDVSAARYFAQSHKLFALIFTDAPP